MVRLSQLSNTPGSIHTTLSGIVMLLRLVQSQNAHSLIKVIVLGRFTFVSDVQLSNTPATISVTLLGVGMTNCDYGLGL